MLQTDLQMNRNHRGIKAIASKRILVVGDVMLDTYFHGDVKRISPEAPVPVFLKKWQRSVPGGAGNVAANLVAAGQTVSVLSVIGKDENGAKLEQIFKEHGIDTKMLFPLKAMTTVKTRFLANNNQQVIRLDEEDSEPLNEAACSQLLLILSKQIADYDVILVSDYLKGLLTFEFMHGIMKLAKEHGLRVVVDVKDPNCHKYDGAFLLKPNLKELSELTGRSAETDDEIISASEHLKQLCNCQYVLTTCGGRGMVLIGDGEPYFIEANGREVFDVTGAGDTAIAYLATCIANEFSVKKAVDIANIAAGIQVSKVGTSSVSLAEIKEFADSDEYHINRKLLLKEDLALFREKHRNRKIVFTNGCFDILHVGHIRYLEEAAKLGDILVVGLNSDSSVKRLKGEERPINKESDRAEMLGALNSVDNIVIFENDTPLELIETLKPDVLVKGGDYTIDQVVGAKEVAGWGGKVELIPFVEGKSTTGLIEKIRR